MKNLFFILILLFQSTILFSQETLETVDAKGEWFVNNYFGVAVLEAEDFFKTNAIAVGGMIGREFYLTKNYSLLAGLEHQRLMTDVSGIYVQNMFLNLPLGFRFYSSTEKPTSVFIDGGLYAGYLYNSKVEDVIADNEDSESGEGFNFGAWTTLGVQHRLNDSFNVRLGLQMQTDLFQSYADDVLKYKIKGVYAFQIGLGYRL